MAVSGGSAIGGCFDGNPYHHARYLPNTTTIGQDGPVLYLDDVAGRYGRLPGQRRMRPNDADAPGRAAHTEGQLELSLDPDPTDGSDGGGGVDPAARP